jgi:glutaredoxin
MPNVQRFTATRISTLSIAPGPASAEARAEEDRTVAETPRAVAGRNEPGQTVLFTSKQCAACDEARAYLVARRVPFYEFDIDTSHGYRSLIETGTGTNKGAPMLVGRNYKLQGFSAKAYDGMFARRAKPAEPPAVRDTPDIQQASRPALQPVSRPAPLALTEGRQISQLER